MNVAPHTPVAPADLLSAALGLGLSRDAAVLAASHWCVETAGGASMYGDNPGNLTCGASPGAACGKNPLVTASLVFAMYGSLADGATAYTAFLQSRGALASLQSGDLGTFSAKLSAIGYAGAGVPASTYASQIGAWQAKLAPMQVSPPVASSSSTTTAAVLLAAGVAGLATSRALGLL